jgi:carboxylesterase type B
VCPAKQSEDCLYLNIFLPLTASVLSGNPTAAPLPVQIYYHGGEFEMGSASAPVWNGGFVANRSGVAVVTADFRLGALGNAVTQGGLQGNYALQVIRAPLYFLFSSQWLT